jgi:tRNA pseudouridine55 synthase
VRRLSDQRRIGHTGTLDPLASGVLVLCLGLATRLVEYYQGEEKQYAAEILLGCATDTYDVEGAVTARAPVPPLTPGAIEAALGGFRGEVLQTPPAFSAIKQEGEALYARARRGEAVTVEPRPVTFYRLDLLDFQPPDRLQLAITCSAGAYVRSLAHDLGQALGTLGTLSGLRREAAGHFTLADAHTLAAIEAAAQEGTLDRLLVPPGTGLPLRAVQLPPALLRRLGQGQRVPIGADICPLPAQGGPPLAQARDQGGALAGIIRCLDAAAAKHSAAGLPADSAAASSADLAAASSGDPTADLPADSAATSSVDPAAALLGNPAAASSGDPAATSSAGSAAAPSAAPFVDPAAATPAAPAGSPAVVAVWKAEKWLS